MTTRTRATLETGSTHPEHGGLPLQWKIERHHAGSGESFVLVVSLPVGRRSRLLHASCGSLAEARALALEVHTPEFSERCFAGPPLLADPSPPRSATERANEIESAAAALLSNLDELLEYGELGWPPCGLERLRAALSRPRADEE